MILPKIGLLKILSNTLFSGMPMITYSPLSTQPLHAPLTVNEGSLYLNFKLNQFETNYLNEYIHLFNNTLNIVPVKIHEDDYPNNYLSINIYNCTSPIFMSNKKITRCEINTYVTDSYNNKGTLIIDYLCNDLSMDPVNIFKQRSKVNFNIKDIYSYLDCESVKEKINLKLNYTTFNWKPFKLSENLIEYTDNIYYKNGIIDKLYYDTSLTKADTRTPSHVYNLTFRYKDLIFNEVDSIFYFQNKINFVGSIWHNLYDL